jgi:5-formyltetrahydrofolate cyclo-ligase
MIWRGTHLRPLSQGPEQASGVAGGTSNSFAASSTSGVAAFKSQLRRHLRIARDAIARPAARRAAHRAALHLLRSGRLDRARCVAVYLASGSELDTAPLIRALHRARKRVLVPIVDARRAGTMHMVPLDPGSPLRRRRYGIGEPVARRRIPRVRVDVMVLPLRGFDRRGTRLGSGAGYYDRWLARASIRPWCVGWAYAIQELPELPREAHDQRLDAVCTERGLRRIEADR